jgi:hypothetical protein
LVADAFRGGANISMVTRSGWVRSKTVNGLPSTRSDVELDDT